MQDNKEPSAPEAETPAPPVQPEPEQPPAIQAPPARSPRLKFNWRRLDRSIARAFSIFVRVTIVIGVLILVKFGYAELTNSNFIIHQISVPELLEKNGFTGEVVAGKIFNEINAIIRAEQLSDVASEYRSSASQVDLNVDIGGFGLPVRNLINVTGEALGMQNRKSISANLTTDGDSLVMELKILSDIQVHKVSLKDGLGNAVNDIVKKSSESILKFSDPYVLARYYFWSNSEGNYKLGRYLLSHYPDDPEREPIGFLAMTASYMAAHNFTAAEEKVTAGLKKYPRDPSLLIPLGTILRNQGRNSEALKRDTETYRTLKHIMPKNLLSNIFRNISLDFDMLHKYDSAIYYCKKAVVIDDSFGEVYLLLADYTLHNGDTTGAIEYFEIASEKEGFDDVSRYFAVSRLKSERVKKVLEDR